MKRVAYYFFTAFCFIPLISVSQQTDYTITSFQDINKIKTALHKTEALTRLKTISEKLHSALNFELSKTRSGDVTDNIEEQSSKYMQALWDMELQLLDITFEDEQDLHIMHTILNIVRKAEIKYFKTFFAIVWSSSPRKASLTKQMIIKNQEKE